MQEPVRRPRGCGGVVGVCVDGARIDGVRPVISEERVPDREPVTGGSEFGFDRRIVDDRTSSREDPEIECLL